jgi:condensin complex subunit 3
MPVSVPRLESLADVIPPIFAQCQASVANHKKNVIALAKIYGQTSDVWEDVPPRGIRLTGEKAFNDRFIDMVKRVLPIKKGIPNADRVVKFIGAFILHISQKGMCTLGNAI